MDVWVVAAIGLFGLLVGSFLNVVIYRVPRGSRCTNCGHELTWFENAPVIAWIALRARCRACESSISAARIDRWVELVGYLVAFAGLLALSAIDIDVQRVPVAVLYPTLGATAVLLAIAAGVDDRWDDLARAIVGAAIGFALLRLIHLASSRGMGYDGRIRNGSATVVAEFACTRMVSPHPFG